MYGLYKDPKGEKIFITPDFQKHSKPVTTGSSQLGTVVDVQGKGSSSVQEDKEVGVSYIIPGIVKALIDSVTLMHPLLTPPAYNVIQVMKLDDKETLDQTDNN